MWLILLVTLKNSCPSLVSSYFFDHAGVRTEANSGSAFLIGYTVFQARLLSLGPVGTGGWRVLGRQGGLKAPGSSYLLPPLLFLELSDLPVPLGLHQPSPLLLLSHLLHEGHLGWQSQRR